jgi:lipopolysaccharide transport system permease protein
MAKMRSTKKSLWYEKIANIEHYRQLVFTKVAANLQTETSRDYLSYLWWVFEPILHMFVYYFVFSFLLSRGTEDYVAFLLTGLIPFFWFDRTVNHSMMSIVSGQRLMMQVHFPKIILPTIVIFQNVVKQLVVVILLLIFLILYGIAPSIYWIALPLLLIVQFLFISACAYLVSALIPFLPDLRFLISMLLRMVFFCSGVFFSVEMIPAHYHKYFFLNPMASLLRDYRAVLIYAQWPNWQPLLYITECSLIGIIIMWIVIQKLDHTYPRIVI